MKDKTFHYTNEKMVQDLLALTPIKETDSVLDAGSGENKVWFNTINVREKYECEIEDGNDFLEWTQPVDWVIGNPPFHLANKFLIHASTVAQKGMAFLTNHSVIEYFPPKFNIIMENGFYVQHIHLVKDKRWYGNYLYFIFTREPSVFLSWNIKAYK